MAGATDIRISFVELLSLRFATGLDHAVYGSLDVEWSVAHTPLCDRINSLNLARIE